MQNNGYNTEDEAPLSQLRMTVGGHTSKGTNKDDVITVTMEPSQVPSMKLNTKQ